MVVEVPPSQLPPETPPSGMELPQTLGAVQPQQTPDAHMPQLMVPVPQPFPTTAQFIPPEQVVCGVHIGVPHTFAEPPPPHVCPAGQPPPIAPQVMVPVPQP